MRFFLFALALFVTDAAAQDSKDPVTAQLYSFVVPGGGQFYSGETLKGAVLVTGVVGGLAYASTTIPKLREDVADRGYYTKHGTTLGVGLGVAGALWIYGIIDAPNAARRANRRTEIAVAPRFDGGGIVTVRVGL